MQQKPDQRYLDLMKKVLSYSLWPEPPIPIEHGNYYRGPVKRFIATSIANLLKTRRLQLVQEARYTDVQRKEGQIWPGQADTMIGLKRLDNLQYCLETVIKDGIEGDFIETGVWRGGASIFARAVLAVHHVTDRKVFVADSFEGLPKPDAERWAADKGDIHHTYDVLAISQEEVEANFKKYGLLDDQVVFLKGWFKDTLPTAPIQKLSVLRLDGDMYGSTMDALTNLYSKLSSGGFCIIDDYFLKACRQAVEDFRAQNGITTPLEEVDRMSKFWRKT